jgi:ferric-dicitrate binding protein FerR (iron transport regulator)
LLQKSNQLVYDKDLKIETLVFHSLKVPYGKRFDIILSDNSKVYLNSGSTLKYPVKFLDNQIREVFLEGEAFFEVSEDEKNIFRVNSNGINVEVYGTKFNFKNYPEDYISDVVLVNGSVGISSSENKSITKLSPGFKGSVDKESFKVDKVKINTKIYTSWIMVKSYLEGKALIKLLKNLRDYTM